MLDYIYFLYLENNFNCQNNSLQNIDTFKLPNFFWYFFVSGQKEFFLIGVRSEYSGNLNEQIHYAPHESERSVFSIVVYLVPPTESLS